MVVLVASKFRKATSAVSTLLQYVEDIVIPTYDDFLREQTARRALLAAVTAYHAIDRAADDLGRKSPANLRREWGDNSMAFKLIDVMAHRFKHVANDAEKNKPEQWDERLSLGDALKRMNAVTFKSTMRDVIDFLVFQAGEISRRPKRR